MCGINQSEMVVFGGFAQNECFNDVHVFHLASASWRRLQTTGDVPSPVTSHSVVADQDHMMVFGGTSAEFGVVNSDKLYLLNVADAKWTQLELPGQKPSARYGQSMVRRPDTAEVYIFGGTTGQEFFNDLYLLDGSEMKWVKIEPVGDAIPSTRYRHAAVSTEDHLYVIGGANNQSIVTTAPLNVWAFAYATRTWTEVTTTVAGPYPGPQPRLCHTACLYKNGIYVHGGTNGRDIFGEDLWRLDLSSLKWARLPSPTLSAQLFFHSACITDRGYYVTFGGCLDRSGEHGVAKERSDRADAKWLEVPSLVDLCAFALAKVAVVEHAPATRAMEAPLLGERSLCSSFSGLNILEPSILRTIVPVCS
jgi:N-acetylneuraminic acid mutarotase